MCTTAVAMYLGLVGGVKNDALGIKESIRAALNGRSQVRELLFFKNNQVHVTHWRPTTETCLNIMNAETRLKIPIIDVVHCTFDRVPRTV
jgi:hypothetical protein